MKRWHLEPFAARFVILLAAVQLAVVLTLGCDPKPQAKRPTAARPELLHTAQPSAAQRHTEQRDTEPTPVPNDDALNEPRRHLFYSHGRIVQQEGPSAVSPRFGEYRYHDIVRALAASGARIHAPLREPNTSLNEARDDLVRHVDALRQLGVASSNITLVGASQGAVITMLASQELGEPKLKLVILGACNPFVRDQLAPDLHGQILSIYEQGDEFGGSCREIVERSRGVSDFKEIKLTTGLGHGFLYTPRQDWLEPTIRWSTGVHLTGRTSQ